MTTLKHNKGVLVKPIVPEFDQIHRIYALIEHAVRGAFATRDSWLRAHFTANSGASMSAIELLVAASITRPPDARQAAEQPAPALVTARPLARLHAWRAHLRTSALALMVHACNGTLKRARRAVVPMVARFRTADMPARQLFDTHIRTFPMLRASLYLRLHCPFRSHRLAAVLGASLTTRYLSRTQLPAGFGVNVWRHVLLRKERSTGSLASVFAGEFAVTRGRAREHAFTHAMLFVTRHLDCVPACLHGDLDWLFAHDLRRALRLVAWRIMRGVPAGQFNIAHVVHTWPAVLAAVASQGALVL
jgi:hypothetical protein